MRQNMTIWGYSDARSQANDGDWSSPTTPIIQWATSHPVCNLDKHRFYYICYTICYSYSWSRLGVTKECAASHLQGQWCWPWWEHLHQAICKLQVSKSWAFPVSLAHDHQQHGLQSCSVLLWCWGGASNCVHHHTVIQLGVQLKF